MSDRTSAARRRNPPHRAIREAASLRGEIIVTLLLDGLMILTAIMVRWIILRVLREFSPADTETWAVRRLEWICDVGIVGAASLFTAFDLLKRLILGLRSLAASVRSPLSSQEEQ